MKCQKMQQQEVSVQDTDAVIEAGIDIAKYQQKILGIEPVVLPSTSPANAAFSLERLEAAWQAVRERL